MKAEESIKIISSKVGANVAFDLLRDSRFKALENLLIEKEIATKEEIKAEQERCFGEMAENILKMPPLPPTQKK